MRFLLDESADFVLSGVLKRLGHDVTAIVHDYPRSLADEDVLEIARSEGRVVITNDRDFGELVFRQQLEHTGIVLFRLEDEPVSIKIMWLYQVLDHYTEHLRDFIVVTEKGVRVRRVRDK